MRKFKFGKLVRDKIVDAIIASGNTPKWTELDNEEYIQELRKKILEEALELSNADKTELAEEIADVQELIDNLIEVLGVSKQELASLQEKKNSKNGSFKKRQFIDIVEVRDDAKEIEYYLKYPDKYPEIK